MGEAGVRSEPRVRTEPPAKRGGGGCWRSVGGAREHPGHVSRAAESAGPGRPVGAPRCVPGARAGRAPAARRSLFLSLARRSPVARPSRRRRCASESLRVPQTASPGAAPRADEPARCPPVGLGHFSSAAVGRPGVADGRSAPRALVACPGAMRGRGTGVQRAQPPIPAAGSLDRGPNPSRPPSFPRPPIPASQVQQLQGQEHGPPCREPALSGQAHAPRPQVGRNSGRELGRLSWIR